MVCRWMSDGGFEESNNKDWGTIVEEEERMEQEMYVSFCIRIRTSVIYLFYPDIT
jgi:hypothetical protein